MCHFEDIFLIGAPNFALLMFQEIELDVFRVTSLGHGDNPFQRFFSDRALCVLTSH